MFKKFSKGPGRDLATDRNTQQVPPRVASPTYLVRVDGLPVTTQRLPERTKEIHWQCLRSTFVNGFGDFIDQPNVGPHKILQLHGFQRQIQHWVLWFKKPRSDLLLELVAASVVLHTGSQTTRLWMALRRNVAPTQRELPHVPIAKTLCWNGIVRQVCRVHVGVDQIFWLGWSRSLSTTRRVRNERCHPSNFRDFKWKIVPLRHDRVDGNLQ